MRPPALDIWTHPEIQDLAYRHGTGEECAFLEAAFRLYGPSQVRRILDVGCGTGRHLLRLARVGYEGVGLDSSPSLIRYLVQRAGAVGLAGRLQAFVGDMREIPLGGPYDAALNLMDTFRYLLTDEEILLHLKQVARVLSDGGLYLIDFWVPEKSGRAPAWRDSWEQSEGGLSVKVLYRQYPKTFETASRTFEDEIIFEVKRARSRRRLSGGRARVRLLEAAEWRALIDRGGDFEASGFFEGFDLGAPWRGRRGAWRLVSVLRKKPAGL